MSRTSYSLLLIVVIALMTVITRFLPFVIFREGRKIPKALEYLGAVLPGAIMGMLVVYCFKETTVLSWPLALPELFAAAGVAGLYLWTQTTLLSIGAGTVLYMVLVQVVFV